MRIHLNLARIFAVLGLSLMFICWIGERLANDFSHIDRIVEAQK